MRIFTEVNVTTPCQVWRHVKCVIIFCFLFNKKGLLKLSTPQGLLLRGVKCTLQSELLCNFLYTEILLSENNYTC